MHLGRALVALVAALTVVAGTGLSAEADPTANARPVTAPDRVTGRAGDLLPVKPLANDSDPDGDDLTVSRLGPRPAGLSADFSDDTVIVSADRPGTYTLDYYACDLEYLTKGTITVVVTPRPVVRVQVTKLRRPGRIRVVNRDDVRVSFAWGSSKARRSDGSRWLRPGRGVTVRVRRHSIMWVAVDQGQSAYAIGHVRRIRLPRGTRSLPADTYAGQTARPVGRESVTAPSWWRVDG
jgi:hypothetical protein